MHRWLKLESLLVRFTILTGYRRKPYVYLNKCRKPFNNMQHCFIINFLEKRSSFLSLVNGSYQNYSNFQNYIAKIIYNCEVLKVFPWSSGTQWFVPPLLLFNIVLECFTSVIRQEKGNKSYKDWKGKNLKIKRIYKLLEIRVYQGCWI